MHISINLDRKTVDALTDAAFRDRRQPQQEAEVIIMQVLGTYEGSEPPIGPVVLDEAPSLPSVEATP